MSLTFSGHAPQPKSYVGISLVVAIHVAVVSALSLGLMKSPPKPAEIITLKPLPPDVDREPPPPEPLPVVKPTLKDPSIILVPPPDVIVAAPVEQAPLQVAVAPKDPGPVTTGPGTPATTVAPQAAPKTQLQAAGAVCAVMPRPDVPAVNWSGEAVLQVVATVRGGRVVGSDFRVLQGALDAKTRRSLQRSVESALAGYQCQGEATFQQDFAFRLD